MTAPSNVHQNSTLSENFLNVALEAAIGYGVSYVIGKICKLRAHDFAAALTIGRLAQVALATLATLLGKQFNWSEKTVKAFTLVSAVAVGVAAINTLLATGVIGTTGAVALATIQAAGMLATMAQK